MEIPRVGFVDDLLELARSIAETQITCVSDEVFERQNCLCFKPCKCKVLLMNLKPGDESVVLDGELLEILDEHKHLGTLVSNSGKRTSDVVKRINDCKGVLNEIVEICKTEALGNNRYMCTLLNACFMLKFKHGCEVWDKLSKKHAQIVNSLVPQAIKRVLMLPRSTPTNAVKHDFGLIDMVREVEMEKLVFTSNVLEMNDNRIAKRLLSPMMEKVVPGYCSHVVDILQKYDLKLANILEANDKRKFTKECIVQVEKEQLFQNMMLGSKTDAMITNFCYNGKMSYLCDLPFESARIIFMFRSRMFPTRVNFPERWCDGINCIYCGKMDTDEHLFTCWGFVDITANGGNEVDHNMFYKLDAPLEELVKGAGVLQSIFERLSLAQDDKDMLAG